MANIVTKPQYGTRYRQRRAEMLENEAFCRYCGSPATIGDHVPPIALHAHLGDDAGCCVLVPSCQRCSNQQGAGVRAVRAQIRAQLGRQGAENDDGDDGADLLGLGPDDACWSVPWLERFLPVPDGCRWPTFMSAPHPDAVDTYGHRVEFTAAQYGVQLRWWQRLTLARLLEHDAYGELCWSESILSTPRRTGKSWLLRELAWWRMTDAFRLFDEDQMVLHTSRGMSVTLDVARPAMTRAREGDADMRATVQSGREELSCGPHRWLLRAEGAAYGLGAGLALCDEAWDYNPSVVSEGIQPTQMERRSPQLLLVSTAHRKATKLIPDRRAAALAELAEPRRRLLVEWSAKASTDLLADAEMASPVWDRARARHVADAIDDARTARPQAGEVEPLDMFVSQYLNDWSAGRQLGRTQGDPLVEWETWLDAGATPVGAPAVVAVEDYFGKSYAVGWAVTDPDSLALVVGGRIVADRDGLRLVLDDLGADELVVGASIVADRVFDGLSALPVGQRETKPALSALRRGLIEGRVFHDGSDDLGQQVADLRVVGREGGLAPVSGQRSDLVRAVGWCVARVEAGRIGAPAVF